jgi:hypothetical protein
VVRKNERSRRGLSVRLRFWRAGGRGRVALSRSERVSALLRVATSVPRCSLTPQERRAREQLDSDRLCAETHCAASAHQHTTLTAVGGCKPGMHTVVGLLKRPAPWCIDSMIRAWHFEMDPSRLYG